MGNNFTVVKLSDITVKITKGTTPSKNDGGFAENGVNYIKAESVSYDGRINESTFAFIDESVHEKLKRSQLEENDILFSMAGAYLGKTGFVKKEHLPANTNQALALIRVNENIANPKFIHYYLQQNSIIHFVNNSISQSAQPNINLQQIGDLNIILPHHSEQTKVVGFMSCLDNKITLNRQINQTLEQMAQALFKSWFVDFDPVVDNALDAGFFEQDLDFPDELLRRAEARKAVREHADFKPLPDTTRQLFPAAFEECAEPSLGLGGWVPQGWCVSMVGNRFKLLNGFPFKSDIYVNEGEFGIVTIKNVQDGYFVDNCSNSINVIPKKMNAECILSEGDIIMSLTGNVGRVCITGKGKYLLNQRVVKLKAEDGVSNAFTYSFFRERNLFERMLSIAKGTAQQNLSPIETGKLLIALPENGTLSILSGFFNDNHMKYISLMEENNILSNLRDTLLPKLISGELRLDNIEADLAKEGVA
ncbi:restriction endonuclease subunit S [Aeromonas salmonicida]|uniref:restriction endonuclease subunit S n=1 Tax=Aeromonas salmonicida TaxID=645 RepID=UPI000730D5C3|nr:restriction endonuclease subunit S [Aeromonas salmonicida]KTA75567.1 hypothetical protein VO68_15355 [Aeromonas salmonicida]